MDIDCKVAIVTGGASGLGEAVARCLAKQGAIVSIFDVNRERGEAVAQEIHGFYSAVDIADENSVIAGFAASQEANGQPHILVNCAGVGDFTPTVSDDGEPHPLKDFKRPIDVNLIGAFNCIRYFSAQVSKLPELPSGERGVIVNTASIAAFDGLATQAAYSASKAGIVGMTLPIARDLGAYGIRICTIAPGLFATPLLDVLPEGLAGQLAAQAPFPKRLGDPMEFAALVRHICENPMLNGATIRLDGAMRMNSH